MHVLICNERFLFRFGVDRALIILGKGLKELGHTVSVMVTANRYDRAVVESFASQIIEIPDVADDYLNSNENTAKWIENTFLEHFENTSFPSVALIGGWPFFASIPFFKGKGLEVVFMDCGAVPLEGFSGGSLIIQEKLRSLRKQYLPEASQIIGISNYIVQSQSKIDTKDMVPVQTVLLGADHVDSTLWDGEDLCLKKSSVDTIHFIDSLKAHEKKLILCLGRWEPYCYKNSEAMFDVMRQIRTAVPDCALLILADPTNVEIPDDLQKLVFPIGFPDDSELKYVMSQADLGISPSLWEGFNLPIAEMQWLGRPVLAFNLGAHPEVILDPWYLCNDMNDMVVKALEILNGHELETSKREASLEKFRESFRWDRVIMEYNNILKDLQEGIVKDKAGSLTIIVDVTNASRDPANSGVIRVTRRICKELQRYLDPVFVVWDSSSKCYLLPNKSEFKQLGEFNGPLPGDESKLSPDDHRVTLHEYLPSLGGTFWLLFTETVDETHARVVRQYARDKGINLAAIFYDAIPVLYPDLCKDLTIKQNHRQYMTGLAECDVVIPISNYSAQCLMDFWESSSISGCKVIPNPLPGEFGGAERTVEIPEFRAKSADILCVSTLEPRKNHKTLVQACLLLQEKYPNLDWNLTLVGNRYAGAFDIADYVQSVSANNPHIKWLGVVDDITLHSLYEKASFTVYPSIVEGFGMPILESLWHGKPCICYNKGVMAELAKDGGCLTVDVKNTISLSEAIYRLITDEELHLKLSQEAVAREIKSWDDYIRELLSVLILESTTKFTTVGSSVSHQEPVMLADSQNWEDILYPGCLCEHWQMNHSERLAVTALLSRHKPRCSIEVGTYMGGSLSLISQYSHTVFSIDIDPSIPNKFRQFDNVCFLTGPSKIILPLLLKELDGEQIPVDFILIDGDHSAEGIKQDLESVLSYIPKKPLFIVMHDSFNPECRRGMQEVNWEGSPYVHWVDLDFIPGRIVETGGPSRGEMWGGLGLAYLKPVIRQGPLQINLSASKMHEIIKNCRK